MKKHIFKCIEDWYTAQRILNALLGAVDTPKLPASFNSYAEGDHWIIEL